jgi:hypothetical protein
MALRLGVLPEAIFEMPESDFAFLIATLKLEHEESERQWQTRQRK